jgi:hypothetical protein
MPVNPVPVSAPNGVDLVTEVDCGLLLEAGGMSLTSAQSEALPALIAAASREVQRFLGRLIPLAAYTEIVTPEGGRQDRGEPASAKLAMFPIQSVTRCATGRTTVLTVANADDATNQEATARLVASGDVEWPGLVSSGLNLARFASGTETTDTVSWTTASPYTTISGVATAINALGGGWLATLGGAGSRPDPTLLPAAWLVGAREPKDALGTTGASLDVFATSYTSYSIDRPSSILSCFGRGAAGGGIWGDAFGWDGLGGDCGMVGGYGQIYVQYTAGWSTIPEQLQRVAAELVKASLERLSTDGTLQSETAGSYSWTAKAAMTSLPDWAWSVLTQFKDWKV